VLPPFGERLGEATKERLERLGVEVRLGTLVVGMDEDGVDVKGPDGEVARIPSRCRTLC
jgi:NADH dehydrogenase